MESPSKTEHGITGLKINNELLQYQWVIASSVKFYQAVNPSRPVHFKKLY